MSAKVNATADLKSKLLDRYAKDMEGILGYYDRLILTGMLVDGGIPMPWRPALSSEHPLL